MKKIFLFTSFPSDYIIGGGAIVRYILPEITRTFVVEWNCISRKPTDLKNDFSLTNLVIRKQKLLSYYPIINRFQKKYDALHIWVWAFFKALTLKKNDRIWVVLENDMILMAYYLIKFSKEIRIHISVHDDCLINYPSLDRTDEGKIRYVLKSAESIDVIGGNLKRYYFDKFGVDSYIFRRGVDFHELRKAHFSKKIYRLLFIGSSHSNISWMKLFRWIERFEKSYKFELDIYSNYNFLPDIGAVPENLIVSLKSTLDEREILAISKTYDFSIFFWNDFNKNRIKYSVSTKLTTYLQLGIPMLASIDNESEVYNLFEKGVAFDIEKTDINEFNDWTERVDFNESFKNYIFHFFNKIQLNNNLLDLPFFKNEH